MSFVIFKTSPLHVVYALMNTHCELKHYHKLLLLVSIHECAYFIASSVITLNILIYAAKPQSTNQMNNINVLSMITLFEIAFNQ